MFNSIIFVCVWLRAFRPNSCSTAIDFSLCTTHDNQLRFHNVTSKNEKNIFGTYSRERKNVGPEMIYMPSNTVIASNIKYRVLQGKWNENGFSEVTNSIIEKKNGVQTKKGKTKYN